MQDSPADHPADPVPYGQAPVKSRCDFCSGEDPQFILPARDFEVLRDHVSRGDWSACGDCADLIRAGKWSRVVDRAAMIWARKEGRPMPQEVRNSLQVMFSLLRKNVTGPVRPVNPPGSAAP